MRSSLRLVVLAAVAGCGGSSKVETPAAAPSGPGPVSAARPAVATQAPKLRLPSAVRPTGYAVSMRMSPTEEAFKGTVDVDIDVAEPTNVVWMHAGDNLTIRSATLGSKAGRWERAHDGFVGIVFDEPVAKGRHKLSLAYDGKLPSRDGRGAYRQEDRGDWYVFTQFESTDARRAFPCFDEPTFKTPWQITLEVPNDQLAFANTTQIGERAGPGGYKTVTFAPSKPLPSYLVAFAVGPFEIVEGGTAGKKKTPVRIIVPKGRAGEAKYAAETTAPLVERLESYFGIPYPYDKLDHIAVPQKGGAMENPGLITYGTGTILGKPEDKSVRLRRGYLSIAAHELGHIWFGDYVTTSWWDDIWLNEAFATWISAKMVAATHPEWDGAVDRVYSKIGAMRTDSLVSSRRIRQPIESKHDIVNAFDGITYQKGAAVIAMFESFVGEEPFRKGVHDYLEAHAHGNATSSEFLNDVATSLEKNGSDKAKSLTSALPTFLDQPGVPLVSAELVCDKGEAPKLRLTQERYLPEGSSGAKAQTWSVPVCASYPEGKSCTVMTGPSAELALTAAKACPAWVNPNADAAGYYRVGFKGDLFQRLQSPAAKKAPVHERVATLADAIALTRTGRMKEGDVLALVPGIMEENNRHLVGLAAGVVAGLSNELVADEVRPNYRRFVTKTIVPRAQALGWKPKATDDDGTRLLRPGLVALAAREGESALSAEARKLTEAWLGDRKAIDHDLVGTVLAVAGRDADRPLWDKLHAEAKKVTDRKERGQLLDAMASATDPKLIEQNFAVMMSDAFDPRESLTLLFGATGDAKTRPMAWDFLKANYDRIVARMPPDWGASLTNLAGRFCDAEHRADAEQFFKDKVQTKTGGPRTLAQNLESISLCEAERTSQRPSVSAFLKKY